jgi:hypothetical protein
MLFFFFLWGGGGGGVKFSKFLQQQIFLPKQNLPNFDLYKGFSTKEMAQIHQIS